MSAQDEPAEHVRFAGCLRALERVPEADESGLIEKVLADPDRTMARSAVLRHLDRRAAELCGDPAYASWAEEMARVTASVPFLVRRLAEWSLLRAIGTGHAWDREALLLASDWLQRKVADGVNPEAVAALAEGGRTRRIRHAARTNRVRRARSCPDRA